MHPSVAKSLQLALTRVRPESGNEYICADVIATLVPAVIIVMLAAGTVRQRSRTAYRWLTGVVTACLLLTAFDSVATLARPAAHVGGRNATETALLATLIATGTALLLVGLVGALELLALPSTRRSLNPR
jgi:hypothetical protein